MKTRSYAYISVALMMALMSCDQGPEYTIPLTGYAGTTQVMRSLVPDSFRVGSIRTNCSSTPCSATIFFGGILPVIPESILFSQASSLTRGTISFYDRSTGQETYNITQPPAGTQVYAGNPLIFYRPQDPNIIDFWFLCNYSGQQLDIVIWGGENGTTDKPCVYAQSSTRGLKHCLDQSGYYNDPRLPNPYQNMPAIYNSTLQNLGDEHYATIIGQAIQCP
ncbi:MAG: hypothetical protein HYS98_05260 [Deltaproteobacteria bacterium]|nr:hypothetical protein [Deltaproteobacteria bacterium]